MALVQFWLLKNNTFLFLHLSKCKKKIRTIIEIDELLYIVFGLLFNDGL